MKNWSRLSKRQELATGSREWLTACKPPEVAHVPNMPEVEVSCQLEHYKTKSTNWPVSYLVVGTRGSVKSRGQVISQLCFEKTDSSHSTLTLVYIPLISTKCRELPKRILREKPERRQVDLRVGVLPCSS